MEIERSHVVYHRPVGKNYNEIGLASGMADMARPGQFLHMLVPRLAGAVLRRPFSIFKAEDGVLSILYKVVGIGTEALTVVKEGEAVDVMGPLGNGFPEIAPQWGEIALVAGGYGVAPLYLLASRAGKVGVLLVGGATAEDILCVEEFKALGWDVRIATEDGSLGTKGLVTSLLDEWLESTPGQPVPVMFACGPDGMLRAVGQRAIERDANAWLSLDKHMGCGVGACLACVQKIKAADGSIGWSRVCRDGPVYDCRDVVWGDPAGAAQE